MARGEAATLEEMAAFIAATAQGRELVIFPELALNSWGRREEYAEHHRASE